MPPKAQLSPRDKIVKLCKPLELNEEHLKDIMAKFLQDINLGLGKSTHPTSIVKCFITYVCDLPTSKEKGRFLGLDLGGTNFRVLVVNLSEKHFDMKSKIYAVPATVMNGKGKDLFDHIAQCLFNFCKDHKLTREKLPLGFTFSFPLIQKGLSSGILERWTKGYTCSDVIGEDVVKLLEAAIARRKDIDIDVAAVLNDTTGTLMSCAWKNPNTKIGLIIGTGTNSCYVEKMKNAEMYEGDTSKPYVIINTESGAFGDDGKLEFIRTSWDKTVDDRSMNPGKQLHEKMISGMYLGELVKLIVIDAIYDNVMLKGKTTDQLITNPLPTKFLSDIEGDRDGVFSNCRTVLKELGYPDADEQDCADMYYISRCVSLRAAMMVSASMATLLNKMEFESVTIGVDGSLFRFHPGFRENMDMYIKRLCYPTIKFNLMLSEDGSGRGAALVAAVAATEKLEKK